MHGLGPGGQYRPRRFPGNLSFDRSPKIAYVGDRSIIAKERELSVTTPIGVMIEEGPQAWEIVQQRGGSAAIALGGSWKLPDGGGAKGQVYARVVREDSGEEVVTWTPAETDPSAGTWRLRLERVPAGGLYRLETSLQADGNTAMEWNVRGDMIHHWGVGDLWVIAGQSNAAGYGKGPVVDPPEFGVHLLRNSGRWDLATHPFNESTRTIHTENRETANPGHSPFLAFARLVKRETGWPIGLVQTALGGSPLSKWNPAEDGELYRMMRGVVESVGGSVRGVLWYQGCSDCSPELSATYLDRFRHMVDSWRADFGDEALPVLTVQLNRFTGADTTSEDDASWGTVREQQRRAAREIPHVTVIPAIDCPLSDEIHNSPAGNLLIGERMARAALAAVYGQDVHFRAPEIREARYIPADDAGTPSIELQFEHVKGYLLPTGQLNRLFTVQDAEGTADIAACTISGPASVTLKLARRLHGQAYVHGAFERNPIAYLPLDSATYMPLLAFYKFPVAE